MTGKAKLEAPEDKRPIVKGYGEVIDGKSLAWLYQERQEADLKRAEKRRTKQAKVRLAKPVLITPARPSRVKEFTIQSPNEIE